MHRVSWWFCIAITLAVVVTVAVLIALSVQSVDVSVRRVTFDCDELASVGTRAARSMAAHATTHENRTRQLASCITALNNRMIPLNVSVDIRNPNIWRGMVSGIFVVEDESGRFLANAMLPPFLVRSRSHRSYQLQTQLRFTNWPGWLRDIAKVAGINLHEQRADSTRSEVQHLPSRVLADTEADIGTQANPKHVAAFSLPPMQLRGFAAVDPSFLPSGVLLGREITHRIG